MQPKRTITKLLILAGVLLGLILLGAVSFFFYEDYTYGRVARGYPEEIIDSFGGKTLADLDAHCEECGYEKLNNSFLGKYPFSIEAPTGSWLVMLRFDEADTVIGYKVMYSNVDSVLFHNRVFGR